MSYYLQLYRQGLGKGGEEVYIVYEMAKYKMAMNHFAFSSSTNKLNVGGIQCEHGIVLRWMDVAGSIFPRHDIAH